MRVKLTQFLKNQSFTLALLAAVAAAALYPEIGIKGGPLKAEFTSKIAVALTFVIQGLSLPTRQILANASKVRQHVFCQLAIFGIAPALMLGFLFVLGPWIPPEMKAGYFYLAALPTTISSAIVLTSNSSGDSSAALCSTALSNVLGVFVTPLLCSLFLDFSIESGPPISSLIAKLSLLVLLPLCIGQAIRPFVREWANASKKRFKHLSNSFILFIVFAAFCQSVHSGIWQQIGANTVTATLLFSLLFLLSFSAVVWLTSPIATKKFPERIAIFFCGSQKTLASGVPMASILFANLPADGALSVGLIILPLICYHSLQLFLGGALSPYFSERVLVEKPSKRIPT